MPLYVWTSPICLDVSHTFGYPHIFGDIKTYGGQPNMEGIQTYRGVQTFGASNHTKGCPNIGGTQTYRGHPNMGECKHGVSKHTGRHLNIWGCPNILGHPNIQGVQGASKDRRECKLGGGHTVGIQTYGGIQTYQGVHPNIWWHLNIQGASKCKGGILTPLSLKNKLSLCCVCTGGIQTYGGI